MANVGGERRRSDFFKGYPGKLSADSRRVLDMFLRGTGCGLALLDTEFTIICVNEAFAQARNERGDFFPGKHFFDLCPADTRPVFENVLQSAKPFQIRGRSLRHKGQPGRDTLYRDWALEPVFDNESRVKALLVTESDVTDRVRAERALFRSSRILAAMNHAQNLSGLLFEPREILDALLTEMIDLTESEFGFIGRVIRDAEGQACMKVQTILNFSRGSESESLSITDEPQYIGPDNLDTLFGSVIRDGETVMENELSGPERNCGLPEGHPKLENFLGIPFTAGDALEGAIGMANSSAGYDESLVMAMQPLMGCYLRMIGDNAVYAERDELLNSLEQSECLIRDLAVPAVDNEHGRLIELINECYEEMDRCADLETIERSLNAIFSAVDQHFRHEEQLMQTVNYEEFEAHKENHERLKAALRHSMHGLSENPEKQLIALQNTLGKWFGHHFATFDKRLDEYLSH